MRAAVDSEGRFGRVLEALLAECGRQREEPDYRRAVAKAAIALLRSWASGPSGRVPDPTWLRAMAQAARRAPDDELARELIEELGLWGHRGAQTTLEQLGRWFERHERWSCLGAVGQQLTDQLGLWDHGPGQRWLRLAAERADPEAALEALAHHLYTEPEGALTPEERDHPERWPRHWRARAPYTLALLEARPELLAVYPDTGALAASPGFVWRLLLVSLSPLAWRLAALVGEVDHVRPRPHRGRGDRGRSRPLGS